jgi:3-phenylpropionate/cinnamic acid dioxygenase small subunit
LPIVASDDAFSPQELSDRIRIQDLFTAYAAAVDARDWDAFKGFFAADAVLDYTAFGGPRGSADDAVQWLDRAMRVIAASQHLISNISVQVDGDDATARSSVFSPLVIGEGERKEVMLNGGTYSDRLRRTEDGWRITERVAQLAWADRPVRAPR